MSKLSTKLMMIAEAEGEAEVEATEAAAGAAAADVAHRHLRSSISPLAGRGRRRGVSLTSSLTVKYNVTISLNSIVNPMVSKTLDIAIVWGSLISAWFQHWFRFSKKCKCVIFLLFPILYTYYSLYSVLTIPYTLYLLFTILCTYYFLYSLLTIPYTLYLIFLISYTFIAGV